MEAPQHQLDSTASHLGDLISDQVSACLAQKPFRIAPSVLHFVVCNITPNRMAQCSGSSSSSSLMLGGTLTIEKANAVLLVSPVCKSENEGYIAWVLGTRTQIGIHR